MVVAVLGCVEVIVVGTGGGVVTVELKGACVFLEVFLEVRRCCAGKFTLFAAERLFSRMDPHVCLEVTSCCAGVVALFANKRLLS